MRSALQGKVDPFERLTGQICRDISKIGGNSDGGAGGHNEFGLDDTDGGGV